MYCDFMGALLTMTSSFILIILLFFFSGYLGISTRTQDVISHSTTRQQWHWMNESVLVIVYDQLISKCIWDKCSILQAGLQYFIFHLKFELKNHRLIMKYISLNNHITVQQSTLFHLHSRHHWQQSTVAQRKFMIQSKLWWKTKLMFILVRWKMRSYMMHN